MRKDFDEDVEDSHGRRKSSRMANVMAAATISVRRASGVAPSFKYLLHEKNLHLLG